MAEYIEREALFAEFDRLGLGEHSLVEKIFSDGVRTIIAVMPSADVAPVVHGRWDDIPNAYMSIVSKTGTYHGNATTCSICLEVNPNAFKTNYCPNCGARMDGDAHAPD